MNKKLIENEKKYNKTLIKYNKLVAKHTANGGKLNRENLPPEIEKLEVKINDLLLENIKLKLLGE